MAPPEHLLPGVAPLTLLIGRGPDIAVALTRMSCYPDGVDLQLVVRARRPIPDLDNAVLIDNPGRLTWGLRHPGGHLATPDYLADDLDRPARATITPLHGYGTDTTIELGFWLWPLPPASTLTVVCAWPDVDIPETTTVLETAPLRDAAHRSVRLWDPVTG
jgi:hypothetical protein